MEAENKKANNEIENENVNDIHLQEMKWQYYKELSDEYYQRIIKLEEALSKANNDLDYIKTQYPSVWKKRLKMKSLNLSNHIKYEINDVKVTKMSIRIEGWVISTKGQEVAINSSVFSSIKRNVRKSINKKYELNDQYQSGFEITGNPLLLRKITFNDGRERVIYRTNGDKLFMLYIKKLYGKLKKSVKKRGVYRTARLTWYKLIGKPHLYVDSYDQWLKEHRATEEELKAQRDHQWDYMPLISLVVPTYNTSYRYLKDLINSIEMQTYENWELCIADGNSNSKTKKALAEFSKANAKIHVKFLAKNYMISGNTNEAIKMAKGEFVGLLDHDDFIEPNALFEFVKLLNENPDLDFIYSDEDKANEKGTHFMIPHCKPDFSIDALRSFNYITHFVLIRRSLFDQVGLFDSKCDGAQDYDMFLRICDETNKIGHIPKILYHWRIAEKSTAKNISVKSYVLDAGKYALAKHLERNHLKGTVRDGLQPTIYKIDYEIVGMPLVSIIIPTKDHIDDLEKCVHSIKEKSTYQNYEIILIENNSTNKETFAYYDRLKQDEKITVVYWEHEFNYSKINNYGAAVAKGEYLLFLNNDVEVITENWIEEMLMYAQRKDVGAVGVKLYYPDNTVQHAGVIVGLGGVAAHSHRLYPRDSVGYVGRLITVQNLSAVTAACLMVKKRIFNEVGGFTEKYQVTFNDVDFCLKIREKGYLNVMNPFAQLYHYESKSRGLDDTYEKNQRFLSEKLMFREDWHEILEKGDPFYNPNLTLSAEDFSLREI